MPEQAVPYSAVSWMDRDRRRSTDRRPRPASVAFATLDKTQLRRAGRCPQSKPRRYRDGEKLIEAGERDRTFFVVKSGAVEIVDDSGDEPKASSTSAPGSSPARGPS